MTTQRIHNLTRRVFTCGRMLITSLALTLLPITFATAQGIHEIIVKTGDPVQGGTGFHGEIGDFAYVMNNAGQVAFISDITGTGVPLFQPQGIFMAEGATVQELFRSRKAAGTQSGYQNLLYPTLNNAGKIAFRGTRTSAFSGASNSRQVFSLKPDGGLITIASEGSTLPGGNGSFVSPVIPALNELGDISFMAEISNNRDGVYLHQGGVLTEVARTGQAAPDGDGVLDTLYYTRTFNNSGQVGYRATITGSAGGAHDGLALFRRDAAGITQMARTGQTVPGGDGQFDILGDFLFAAITEQGEMAFVSKLTGTAGGTNDDSGFYVSDGLTITELAREGEATPEGNGQFEYIYRGGLPNGPGKFVFASVLKNTSGGTTDAHGIYRSESGALTKIARDGEEAPNGDVMEYVYLLDANAAGHVLYGAFMPLRSGREPRGYFLGNGFDVLEIVREGDTIAGSTITELSANLGSFFGSASSSSSFNDEGQLAYVATLANGKQALMRFTIPEAHWIGSQASGNWNASISWQNSMKPNSFNHTFVEPVGSLSLGGVSTDTIVRSLTIGALGQNASAHLTVGNGGDLRALEHIEIKERGRIRVDAGHKLTAQTIEVAGNLYGDGTIDAALTILPGAVVNSTVGATLTVLGSGPHTNAGIMTSHTGGFHFAVHLTNQSTGLMTLNQGTMTFGNHLTNAGIVNISDGANAIHGDVLNETGGLVQVNMDDSVEFFDDLTNLGTLNVHANATATFYGELAGNGNSSTGDVVALGELEPDLSLGVMSFGGDLTLGNQSFFQIELTGTSPSEYSRVAVAGTTILDGDLEVELMNGFIPQVGDSFEILTAAGGVTGMFDTLQLPNLGSSLLWQLIPTSTTLSLNVVSAASGDFNGDGNVNGEDLIRWQKSYGISNAADADGDGDSDGRDFLEWQRHFVSDVPSVAATAAVPEPGTLLLVCLGILSTGGPSRMNRS